METSLVLILMLAQPHGRKHSRTIHHVRMPRVFSQLASPRLRRLAKMLENIIMKLDSTAEKHPCPRKDCWSQSHPQTQSLAMSEEIGSLCPNSWLQLYCTTFTTTWNIIQPETSRKSPSRGGSTPWSSRNTWKISTAAATSA